MSSSPRPQRVGSCQEWMWGTVCAGIYGMDRGNREHERDSSCGGWESPACYNGEGEKFPGNNGPECD